MLRLLSICLCAALVTACSAVTPPDHLAERRAKHSHPYQLVRDFKGMIESVQGGDMRAPAELMKTYALNESEFISLFGEETAKATWPKYKSKILGPMVEEANAVFSERIAAGYTEIEVVGVSTSRPQATTAGDIAMLEAVKVPVEMYTVRLHRPDENLGLRLNGFVYLDGRWRSLMKTYEQLPESEAR